MAAAQSLIHDPFANCLQFVRLHEDAILPCRATPGSAGYDLNSLMNVTLEPHSRACVHTGIAMIIPKGYYGRIAARSSWSMNYGVEVGAGVVDNDYRGEICVIIHNHSDGGVKIVMGDRVAQMIIEPYHTPDTVCLSAEEWNAIVIAEDKENKRGTGGFGSTGDGVLASSRAAYDASASDSSSDEDEDMNTRSDIVSDNPDPELEPEPAQELAHAHAHANMRQPDPESNSPQQLFHPALFHPASPYDCAHI